MTPRLSTRLAALLLLGPLSGPLIAQAPSPSSLPAYHSDTRVSGVIRMCGADNMLNVLRLWETGFTKPQHLVHYSDQMWSTAQAVGGLVTSTCDIAMMPRSAWGVEELAFHSTFGYPMTEVRVGTAPIGDVAGATSQGLVLIVSRKNPLTHLTLDQVDRIFGAARKGGLQGEMKWSTEGARPTSTDIRTWGQLGLTGDWSSHTITTYGYDLSVNGFSEEMQKLVFHGGDMWNPNYKEFVKSQPTVPGSDRITIGQREALDADPYGIAVVAGTEFMADHPGLKTLAIGASATGPFIPPTRATYANRTYPLIDDVIFFVNRQPGKPIDRKVREFITYVLSREGQTALVIDNAFLPLPASTIQDELKKLD